MKFTILCAFYQKNEDVIIINRFLKSVAAQTFKDYELLMVHDGPFIHDTKVYNTEGISKVLFLNTPIHAGVWGHNCRDFGIKFISGEYTLITNGDNVYSPFVLSLLNQCVTEVYDIYLMDVIMKGMNRKVSDKTIDVWYDTPRDYTKQVKLTGYPPVAYNLDIMLVAMKSSIWKKHGWDIQLKDSDGIIIPHLCRKYPFKKVPILSGFHY